MDREDVKQILRFLSYGLFFFGLFLGLVIGASLREVVEVEVLVDDRLQKCKELGGEYWLAFDEYEGEYYDKCKVPEKKIDLDKLTTK